MQPWGLLSSQRAQINGLIKEKGSFKGDIDLDIDVDVDGIQEYGLNHMGIPNMAQGIFLD